jgi:hypothetical protein
MSRVKLKIKICSYPNLKFRNILKTLRFFNDLKKFLSSFVIAVSGANVTSISNVNNIGHSTI